MSKQKRIILFFSCFVLSISLFLFPSLNTDSFAAPRTPKLSSPSNNSAISSNRVTLSWSIIRTANAILSVRDLTTNKLLLNQQDIGRKSRYSLSALVAGHRYRWTVAAKTTSGQSGFASPAFVFSVKKKKPQSITLSKPTVSPSSGTPDSSFTFTSSVTNPSNTKLTGLKAYITNPKGQTYSFVVSQSRDKLIFIKNGMTSGDGTYSVQFEANGRKSSAQSFSVSAKRVKKKDIDITKLVVSKGRTDGGVDKVKPVVSLSSPKNGQKFGTRTKSIRLSGTISDNKNLSYLYLHNGKRWSPIRVSGKRVDLSRYSFDVTGRTGNVRLITAAKDSAGNWSSYRYTTVVIGGGKDSLLRDKAKPVVILSSPRNNQQFKGGTSRIPLSGSASDERGLKALWLHNGKRWTSHRVSGKRVDLSKYFFDMSGQKGTIPLAAMAQDASGKWSIRQNRTVIIGSGGANKLPVVSLSSPRNNQQFKEGTSRIALSGSVSDDEGLKWLLLNNGNQWASHRVSGKRVDLSKYSFDMSGQKGTVRLTAMAQDVAGKWSIRQNRTVIIGSGGINKPPVVSVSSPRNNQQFKEGTSRIALSGSASDEKGLKALWLHNGKQWTSYRVSGKRVDLSKYSFDVGGQKGNVRLSTIAQDASGKWSNRVNTTVSIVGTIVERKPPILTMTTGGVKNGRVPIQGNVKAGPGRSLKRLKLYVQEKGEVFHNLSGTSASLNNFSFDVSGLKDGTYEIAAVVFDSSNARSNKFSKKIQIKKQIVDDKGEVIDDEDEDLETPKLTSPSNNSVVSGTNVTLKWTIDQKTNALLTVYDETAKKMLFWKKNLGRASSHSLSGLKKGHTYKWALTAKTDKSESSFASYVFSVAKDKDEEVKPAGITSPSPGSTITSSSVTFSWTAGKGIESYRLQIGSSHGGNNLYYSDHDKNTTSVQVRGLPANGEKIYVRLYSNIAGNWKRKGEYFYITAGEKKALKFNSPSVLPAKGTASSLYQFSVNYDSPDKTTYSQIVIINSKGKEQTFDAKTTGNKLSFSSKGTELGNYSGSGDYKFYFKIGKKESGRSSFVIGKDEIEDEKEKLAEIISPAPGSTLTSSSVTFSWSAGKGIKKYNLLIGRGRTANDVYSSGEITQTSINVTNLPKDVNKIHVTLYSYNNGKRLGWQEYTFKTAELTSEKPVINLTQPKSGENIGLNRAAIWLDGHIRSGTGIKYVQIYDGEKWGSKYQISGMNINIGNLGALIISDRWRGIRKFGRYNVGIAVEDIKGNRSEKFVNIIYGNDDIEEDKEKPVIRITSPADGQKFKIGASIPFKGTATDNVELQLFSLKVNGELNKRISISGKETDLSFSIDIEGKKKGKFKLIAVVKDKSGNSSTHNVDFFVEEKVPDETIKLSKPTIAPSPRLTSTRYDFKSKITIPSGVKLTSKKAYIISEINGKEEITNVSISGDRKFLYFNKTFEKAVNYSVTFEANGIKSTEEEFALKDKGEEDERRKEQFKAIIKNTATTVKTAKNNLGMSKGEIVKAISNPKLFEGANLPKAAKLIKALKAVNIAVDNYNRASDAELSEAEARELGVLSAFAGLGDMTGCYYCSDAVDNIVKNLINLKRKMESSSEEWGYAIISLKKRKTIKNWRGLKVTLVVVNPKSNDIRTGDKFTKPAQSWNVKFGDYNTLLYPGFYRVEVHNNKGELVGLSVIDIESGKTKSVSINLN